MKQSDTVLMIHELVAETINAVMEVFKEDIEPLVKFGTPKEVMGKAYEEWSPEDFQRAQALMPQIFKDGGYVAKKEVDSLLELEQEV